MYDAERARIRALRERFDHALESRGPELQRSAEEYLEALSSLIDVFYDGAGSDPRLLGLDTTGSLDRMEEETAWAESERHRVHRILRERY